MTQLLHENERREHLLGHFDNFRIHFAENRLNRRPHKLTEVREDLARGSGVHLLEQTGQPDGQRDAVEGNIRLFTNERPKVGVVLELRGYEGGGVEWGGVARVSQTESGNSKQDANKNAPWGDT